MIVEKCEALNCHDEAWKDWINCDNSYAINDKNDGSREWKVF